MPFLPLFQTPPVIHLQGIPPNERVAMMRGLMDLNPSFAPPQVWDSGRLYETGSGGIKELDHSQPPTRIHASRPVHALFSDRSVRPLLSFTYATPRE